MSTHSGPAQQVVAGVKLHYFGEPRAEFATLKSCGTFRTSTELTLWSGTGLRACEYAVG